MPITGATTSALALTNVQSTNEGSYSVVVSNSAGSVTSSNSVLTLVIAPFILSQSAPLQQWVKQGGNFTLGVTACGAASCGPLGYQWQLNGTNIPPATNATATNATYT